MRNLCSVLIAAAALVLPAASASAASGSDYAKGHGTTFFGDSFAFSATSNFNGTGPRGSVRLDIAIGAQAVTVYGDVTCLRVAGSLASIGGTVTNISPPTGSLAFVQSFTIITSDSGKFGFAPDTLTYFFSSAPAPPAAGCPTPASGLPISTGDVTIQDATT